MRTPLVATVDADTLLMPSSLERIVARLLISLPDTVAVAGAVFVRNSRRNFITRAQEWDYFLGIASVKRQQGLFQGRWSRGSIAEKVIDALPAQPVIDVKKAAELAADSIVAKRSAAQRSSSWDNEGVQMDSFLPSF